MICERQIFSATPEFCFRLFYFSSNIDWVNLGVGTGQSESGEAVRQMEGDREVSKQEMG